MSLIKITQKKDERRKSKNVIFPLDNRHFITEFINKVDADKYYICNELGGVIDFGRTDWFSCDVDNIAVYVDMEVNDEVNDDEIKALIKQLPKFKKRY